MQVLVELGLLLDLLLALLFLLGLLLGESLLLGLSLCLGHLILPVGREHTVVEVEAVGLQTEGLIRVIATGTTRIRLLMCVLLWCVLLVLML